MPQPVTLDSKEMYKLYCAAAENKAKPFCALASISKKPPQAPKPAAAKPATPLPKPPMTAAPAGAKVVVGKGPGKGAGKGAGKKAAPATGERRLDEESEIQVQAAA